MQKITCPNCNGSDFKEHNVSFIMEDRQVFIKRCLCGQDFQHHHFFDDDKNKAYINNDGIIDDLSNDLNK